MKTWPTLAALAFGTALAATSHAQAPQRGEGTSPGPDRPHRDMHDNRGHGPMHHGMFNSAERLAKLKGELNLTPAQEPRFDTFAGVVQKQMEERRALREKVRENRGEIAQLPAPERMARFTEAMKQRVAGMEQTNAALRDFYEALNPAQKAIVDKHFMPRRMHG